jgi:hypothetical protein
MSASLMASDAISPEIYLDMQSNAECSREYSKKVSN